MHQRNADLGPLQWARQNNDMDSAGEAVRSLKILFPIHRENFIRSDFTKIGLVSRRLAGTGLFSSDRRQTIPPRRSTLRRTARRYRPAPARHLWPSVWRRRKC